MRLCQPRAWVPSALSPSSGQQHPVPPFHLGGDGVSTQLCPVSCRELADAVSIPPCWYWRGPAVPGLGRALPCLSLLGQLSQPLLGLSYVQAAG